MNEPFERNWQILIWCLRRGYTAPVDVASTGKLAVFNLAMNGQIRQIAKLKLPPTFRVIRYTDLHVLLFYSMNKYNL